jgi:formylmethanofuran dehydrogenase subunit E
MPTLLCLHCGQDTHIEATDKIPESLCAKCEEMIANWEVELVETEFRCEHEFIAETPGRRPYCAECGLIFR